MNSAGMRISFACRCLFSHLGRGGEVDDVGKSLSQAMAADLGMCGDESSATVPHCLREVLDGLWKCPQGERSVPGTLEKVLPELGECPQVLGECPQVLGKAAEEFGDFPKVGGEFSKDCACYFLGGVAEVV